MNSENKDANKDENNFDIYEDAQKIRSTLVDATHDVTNKAGKLLDESVSAVKNKSASMKDTLINYTEAKPFKSLSIALITGMLLGYLCRQSNHKSK